MSNTTAAELLQEFFAAAGEYPKLGDLSTGKHRITKLKSLDGKYGISYMIMIDGEFYFAPK